MDDPKRVGWYGGGPTPDESVTAVAVGHRDTRTGSAIFAALGQLRPGRLVEARRADGRTAVYTVDAVRTYEKARFPNKEVYGDRGRPELRLITCGRRIRPQDGLRRQHRRVRPPHADPGTGPHHMRQPPRRARPRRAPPRRTEPLAHPVPDRPLHVAPDRPPHRYPIVHFLPVQNRTVPIPPRVFPRACAVR
ncbi:sortase domain-bontaining protein [Streptomyces sp. NPDC001530]|uniref:sortase domain-containing protein n=1 Tax=Streptomyces sp. NPDC001530 TaxID=3364582 RepID=UPI003688F418